MKLGAQLFSLRTECDTPEKLYNTLKRVKQIGYDVVQASAICDIEATRLRAYVEELSLPVTCTHRSFVEITEQTEKCIKFHKTIGCPVVGLGYMPNEFHGSLDGLKKFISLLIEPMKKIIDAGLRFAYHNHAFEFDVLDGGISGYDYMLNEVPQMNFIHDVYWSTYAGEDPQKYISRLAAEDRITDVHFKDMKSLPQGAICPCGDGVIDFAELAKLCYELGIKNAQVEQDNAPDLGDPFAQMERSFKHLKPYIK